MEDRGKEELLVSRGVMTLGGMGEGRRDDGERDIVLEGDNT